MKPLVLLLTVIVGVATTVLPLHSQAPAPAPGAAGAQNPLAQLRAIRDLNAKLLQQQEATLKRLEEIEKDAQTLKMLSRRS